MNFESVDEIIAGNEHMFESKTIVLEPRSSYDKCVAGHIENEGGGFRLCYSVKKFIRALMKDGGMKRSEAYEYFEYNTLRALPYMTDGIAPIFLWDD